MAGNCRSVGSSCTFQEVGLPTCVAASNKLVGVGTLRQMNSLELCHMLNMLSMLLHRGAVVLLDNKLLDIPPKSNRSPQVTASHPYRVAFSDSRLQIDEVLSPGEEASARRLALSIRLHRQSVGGRLFLLQAQLVNTCGSGSHFSCFFNRWWKLVLGLVCPLILVDSCRFLLSGIAREIF